MGELLMKGSAVDVEKLTLSIARKWAMTVGLLQNVSSEHVRQYGILL